MFNLEAVRHQLERAGLDGLIVTTPENFYGLTGCFPKSLITRTTGGEAVVLSAAEREPTVVLSEHDAGSYGDRLPYRDIRTYDTWIYFERAGGGERRPAEKPEQYDSTQAMVEAVGAHGLTRGRIGIEEDLVSAATYNRIRRAIPDAELVNATRLLYDLRSVKGPAEIGRFREAAAITEQATQAALVLAREGVGDQELARAYKMRACELGAWLPGHCGHVNFSCGADSGAAHVAGPFPPGRLRAGEVLRLDVGILYRGVVTDFARAYLPGSPSDEWRRLHETLLRANRRMVGSLHPGIRFCDLFQIGIEVIRRVYPQYNRGHLGHSISLGPNPEEPPFISAKETREVQAGMVLCVEAPFYILGSGGMNIEDMVVVTDTGVEELTHLDRGPGLPAC